MTTEEIIQRIDDAMEYTASIEAESILNQCKMNAKKSHPTPLIPSEAPKIKQKLCVRTDVEGTDIALEQIKQLSIQGEIALLISEKYRAKTGQKLYKDVSRFCYATKHDLEPRSSGVHGQIQYRCKQHDVTGCPFCLCFEWSGGVWKIASEPEQLSTITRTCPLCTDIPQMRRNVILKAAEPVKKKKKKTESSQ